MNNEQELPAELMTKIAAVSAELSEKKLRLEYKVSRITTYIVNTVVWVIVGGIGLAACWGIMEVVKGILVTLGLRG
jgi:hypothetical protein